MGLAVDQQLLALVQQSVQLFRKEFTAIQETVASLQDDVASLQDEQHYFKSKAEEYQQRLDGMSAQQAEQARLEDENFKRMSEMFESLRVQHRPGILYVLKL